MTAIPSMFDSCSRVVVEGRDPTGHWCAAVLCVSCESVVAVVRWWLGFGARVVGVCWHVAGNGNLVCVHAQAVGYCRETDQAGHRIG